MLKMPLNRIYIYCLSLIFLLLQINCSEEQRILTLNGERDLIPEGIAIDPETKLLYLSSIHKKKILATNLNDLTLADVIESEAHGFKLGVGMEIKDGKLFALSGEEIGGESSSLLIVIDIATGELLHKYEVNDSVNNFMNDLAISEQNEIYITDTKRHCVYKLDYPNGEMNVFLTSDDLKHPNGITIADHNKYLYVDSWFGGVRIVDLSTSEIINEQNAETSEIGIDGLKYFEGDLYAIRNGGEDPKDHGLIKIELSDNGQKIERVVPLLMNDSLMNVPTTIEIFDSTIYILANSQMDNLNQDNNTIIDRNLLTDTYIIKYDLK